MQGYFELIFRGTKNQLYELINYVTSKKNEDNLHDFLFWCVGKPGDFDELTDDEKTSVEISMSNVGGSGNISGLDIEGIVRELCSAVPALSMWGYEKTLDADFRQEYTSIAGSEKYKMEFVAEYYCAYCYSEIDSEDPQEIYSDRFEAHFCNEECYKSFLIERITDEDENANEEELQQMDIEALEKRYDEL